MASPSPGVTEEAGHSVKRDRKWIYCDHCQKEVSKSTYYRHKRQRLDSESESELSDDCNDDPKFVWSDDEEVDVIIGDHASAIENSPPLQTEVSCRRHKLGYAWVKN